MHAVHNLTPYALKSILILSSHLRLGLPSGLFPPGFPTKISYTTLIHFLQTNIFFWKCIIIFVRRTVYIIIINKQNCMLNIQSPYSLYESAMWIQKLRFVTTSIVLNLYSLLKQDMNKYAYNKHTCHYSPTDRKFCMLLMNTKFRQVCLCVSLMALLQVFV